MDGRGGGDGDSIPAAAAFDGAFGEHRAGHGLGCAGRGRGSHRHDELAGFRADAGGRAALFAGHAVPGAGAVAVPQRHLARLRGGRLRRLLRRDHLAHGGEPAGLRVGSRCRASLRICSRTARRSGAPVSFVASGGWISQGAFP